MTTEFTATSPGKLVIAGEYAVLDGALAISAAVNKRAMAVVKAASAGELLIANTGMRFPFALGADGQPVWLKDPGDSGAVLAAVLETLAYKHRLRADPQPWHIELCSQDFFTQLPGGALLKLGIGSSAAISVALLAALQSCIGQRPDFEDALAVHRTLQKGAGSGIDIATSWCGGVVLMQPIAGAMPSIEQLSWPAGFHISPVWTGQAASTPAMLRQLSIFRQTSSATFAELIDQFKAGLAKIHENWRLAKVAELVNDLHHYGELLAELDKAATIGIWSERHRAFEKLAKSMQIGYKPSGAGGGDFGLAFSADATSLERFVHEVHTQLVPQTHGVRWVADGLLINGRAVAGPA